MTDKFYKAMFVTWMGLAGWATAIFTIELWEQGFGK
jgi:hypothetical protein